MLGSMVAIKVLNSGQYKVVVWGSNDDHIMDWLGCNYHIKTVEGQPHRGFVTYAEAVSFAREKFSTRDDVHEYGRRCGDGSFMGDNPKFQMLNLSFGPDGLPDDWDKERSW